MSSAARQVASTTELIELILLQTDMRTLLVSVQRVCHTWQNLVKTSKRLQRALYFEAIPPSSDKEITAGRTLNPLLVETFPTFFQTPQEKPGLSHWVGHTTFDNAFSFMDETRAEVPNQTTKNRVAIPRRASGHTKRKAYLRKDASWRRMQVQHPAAPSIGFSEARIVMEPSYHSDIISPSAGGHGVTMGMLYDAVYQFMGQPGSHSVFRVYWRDLVNDQKYEYWPLKPKPQGSPWEDAYDFPDKVGIVVMRTTSRGTAPCPSKVSILNGKYRPGGMQLYKMELTCRFYVDFFG